MAKKRLDRNVRTIPNTVQKSIPYKRVYDDKNTNGGIIEVVNGKYTKSYFIEDANYSDIGDEGQDLILKQIEKILNTFNHIYTYQLSINNRTIDYDKTDQNQKIELKDEFIIAIAIS